MVNDLAAGTVIRAMSFFVFPAVAFTVSGSNVEVSESINGTDQATFNTSVKAMGNVSFAGGTYNSGIDVNGNTITFTQISSYRTIVNSPISGTGTINAYFATINGNNTFSGLVYGGSTISGGNSLRINGSFASALLRTAAFVTGSGSVATFENSGTVSPDRIFSTGTTTFTTAYSMNADQKPTLAVRINGPVAGSSYDQLRVTSLKIEKGGLYVTTNHFTPSAGQQFVIVDNQGSQAVTGTFETYSPFSAATSYPEGSTVLSADDDIPFRITYHGGDGNDVVLSTAAAATVAVTTTPNPNYAGQSVTVDVTVSGASGTPTGSVTVSVGGKPVGTSSLVNGHATVTTAPFAGTNDWQVTAAYSGDGTYAAATGQTTQHVISNSTATSVSASPNPAAIGQNVTFNATVTRTTGAGGSAGTAGTVTFKDNSAAFATQPVTNGTATFQSSSLAAGDHAITAEFSGSGNDQASASAPVTLRIRNSSTVSANVLAGSQQPRILVHVSGNGSVPTGAITVSNGATIIGSGTLDASGYATIELQGLAPSTYTLTVAYNGDSNYTASSTTAVVTINALLLVVGDVATAEGNSGMTNVTIGVLLSTASSSPIVVDFATVDGTATAPADYTSASGTVRFEPGEVQKQITVAVVGDRLVESEERFYVRFSSSTAPELARQIAVLIFDDDGAAIRDLEFENVAGTSLKLDLFLPSSGTPLYPLIVAIDAADWNSPQQHSSIVTREVSRGYAVALLSFRPASVAAMPAQLEDVKTAVRWLRANAARYALNSSRIGAWGIGTAGGHLALLLGMTGGVSNFDNPSLGNINFSSSVDAVVDWYGAADLAALQNDQSLCGSTATQVTQLLRCASGETCAGTARAASPQSYASASTVPLLLMHGSSDCAVPPLQSQSLAASARNATLVINTGAGHGGAGWETAAIVDAVDAFLDGNVKATPRDRRRSARH
jgi:acetyl esterase/lipase